ncbi:hypothetical protein [Pleurocapsa sp. PCC 7327]|uniref:hypothetical protein n=1 Tax=Pleurocapsa sp. PCC 7327 TaxID=118163 RepID=UPI001C2FA65E|nr:hypothetical protein [Pleurocapsa sp. PCC 7327]
MLIASIASKNYSKENQSQSKVKRKKAKSILIEFLVPLLAMGWGAIAIEGRIGGDPYGEPSCYIY